MNNIKDAIKREMMFAKISNDSELYHLISKINKDEENWYEKYQKAKGNFSKKLKGERNFSFEEILALEAIFNKSMYSILHNVKLNFENKGIRYAAYIDDYDNYDSLDIEIDNRPFLLNYDEFDKNILDYIIEYNSFNGIKYLIEKKYLYYNGLHNLSNDIVVPQVYYQSLAKLIISKADLELLLKFISFTDNIGDRFNESTINNNNEFIDLFVDELINNRDLLKKLSNHTEEITLYNLSVWKNRVLISKKEDNIEPKGLFVHPLINYVINHKLSNIKGVFLIEFLYSCKSINERVIKYLSDNNIEYDYIDDYGNIIHCHTIVGNCVYINNESNIVINSNAQGIIDYINSQIRAIKDKNICKKIGDYRVENNMILIDSVDNPIMYDMLNLVKYEDINYILKYIKSENGVDYFEYNKILLDKNRLCYNENYLCLFEELGKFHKLCMKHLGDNKVYCHGFLNSNNVIIYNNELKLIKDWNSVSVDSPYNDFFDAFIHFYEVFNAYKLNELKVDSLVEVVNAYNGNDVFKKDFYNKFISYINNCINKIDDDRWYKIKHSKLLIVEAWLKLNKNEIEERIG